MFQQLNLKTTWVFLIPFITLLWSLYILWLSGPFYLSRIDPDYIYLLNGLNCATLDFYRIGHIDHPGTPFQLLTGLFILITHWLIGQGPLVDDVISRPEMYLSSASLQLTLITAFIILWLGKLVMKNGNDVLGALIIQSSLVLNVFLIDLPNRYIPERMLALIVLMFTGFCFKHFYTENYSGRKYAIHSGILLGIGFVTKFNFLPILIIPLFLIAKMKDRLIYIITLVVTAVICFLPVHDKFSYFKGFVISLIKHDGLYGGGSQQVFNPDVFWHNVILIFRGNIPFTIVLGISLAIIVFLIIKPSIRKNLNKEFLYSIALIFAAIIGALITAKHFKEHYIIPVISLTGFSVLILLKTGRKIFPLNYVNIAFILLLVYFVYLPWAILYRPYTEKKKNNYHGLLTADFISKNVSSQDYLLIEPTWLSGGMIENGMAYGLSYVASRHYYYNEFERYYPNALTWIDNDRPLQYLKMIDASNETVFKSGADMYLYSSPGRNADVLCNYIDSCALVYGISYQRDTVYKNSANGDIVIRLRNLSGWYEKMTVSCGFERFDDHSLFSDDEQFTLTGQFNLSHKFASNGFHSLELTETTPRSPEMLIHQVHEKDYFEVTVKRKRTGNEVKGNLYLCTVDFSGAQSKIAKGFLVSAIHENCELLRLTYELHDIVAGGYLTVYYEYPGKEIEFIDDFTIRHFSLKN
jgi:hypothetical protein